MQTPEAILARFAALARVEVSDLTGGGRSSFLTRLRGECMWHMRMLSGATLEEVGAAMGGRGSATVRESIETVRVRLTREPDLVGHLDSMAMALRIGMPEPEPFLGVTNQLTAELWLSVVSSILANVNLTAPEARSLALLVIRASGPSLIST